MSLKKPKSQSLFLENAMAEKDNPAPSASVEEKKVVTLRSSDGEVFEVEEAVAFQSETIKNLVVDGCGEGCIPLPNVSSKSLTKVIEFCKNHIRENTRDDSTKKWVEQFLNVERDDLFDFILAANYLDVKDLLDATCQRVADIIKDKTVEYVRDYFNIKTDFSPDEEAAIRRENQWAFE